MKKPRRVSRHWCVLSICCLYANSSANGGDELSRVFLCLNQDTKVTVNHIQVALRSHDDFAQLLERVEGAALVLEFFLDDSTSRALYERHLITTPDAKHLRGGAGSGDDGGAASEEELIRMHERTRAEWQKREDDPFTEVDFAMVLKCAHPAFTLSYNATALLSALVRELLNGVCDLAQIEAVQRRVPPELYLEDIEAPLARVFHAGDTGAQVARTARDCLERFRLRSRKGTTLSIRFSVFSGPTRAVQQQQLPQCVLSNVPRETPFAQLLLQMCKKCHADAAAMAVVYRGRQVEPQSTPAALSMPTGGVVFLVSKKWWDYTRRNEARRGLLSSLRPQDAQLKSLVKGTESKVKKEIQVAPNGPEHPSGLKSQQQHQPAVSPSATVARREERSELRRAKQQLDRSNNASSTDTLHAAHVGSSVAAPRHAASPSRRGGHADDGRPSPKAAAPRHRRKDRKLSDSDSEDPSLLSYPNYPNSAADDDSLSLLLKQRPEIGMALPSQQLSSSSLRSSLSLDNNLSEDALSEMQQRYGLTRSRLVPHSASSTSIGAANADSYAAASSPAATGRSLAARNAQLMSTLDAAWLGFAAISGGARSMDAKLSKWRSSVGPSGGQEQNADGDECPPDAETELAELEVELLARLEKTEELVAQTLAAKQLMAQLVEQVQRHPQRRRRSRQAEEHLT